MRKTLFVVKLELIATLIYICSYILTAASDYLVAGLGGICTGIENFPLFDKDECMKASTSLNKNWQGEVEDANSPRGCYFISSAESISGHSGDVYWNIHKTGKIHGDCAAICRKPRNNL